MEPRKGESVASWQRRLTALRDRIVKYAEKEGWKPWGRMRKQDGSSYQCFRRGNHYAWIGWRHVQTMGWGLAEDYVAENRRKRALYLLSRKAFAENFSEMPGGCWVGTPR